MKEPWENMVQEGSSPQVGGYWESIGPPASLRFPGCAAEEDVFAVGFDMGRTASNCI